MIGSALFAALLVRGARVSAFAPMPMPPASASVRRHRSADTRMGQMFGETSALEVVDEEEEGAVADDPWESYRANDEQKDIAVRDVTIGDGYTVGEVDDQLLQIRFTAKFVEGKFTADIREFDVPSMVFKTGQERCLPGLEEGIQGMKVGGNRKVRVPPGKGYGDQWYRGIVPPNSHLEFDCTLVKIAQGPGEEFGMQLEQFGVERAVGATACLAYLAISPWLEKQNYFGIFG